MRQKITLPILATALLLVAATLGTASCSQNDDALPAGTAVARGGEPLNIRIAPKPGYTESANTRATVNDDTGAFAWEAGDNIIVFVTFNDAAATTVKHWGTYHSGSTASYIADWDMVELRDNLTGSPAISKLAWPLGASRATVRAVYSANLPHILDTPGYFINSGEDHMRFSKTVTLGETLTIDFAHFTTRLIFTGLAANTKYSLKVNGVAATFPSYIDNSDLTFYRYYEQSFTSDASGNLIVHAELDDKIDANGKLKLELVKNRETTPAYQTTLTAQGTAGAYKMDGYIYKIKVSSGGQVNSGNSPDLVTVPIVPGNMIWELNGYYITAPDANVDKKYQWSASESATVMDNDPCVGHGNWRMPSMKDFEKMAGWTETCPWSQGVGEDHKQVSNEGIWYAAFKEGGHQYWSTDVVTSDETRVWCMLSISSGPVDPVNGIDGSCYNQNLKTGNSYVRCVQLK